MPRARHVRMRLVAILAFALLVPLASGHAIPADFRVEPFVGVIPFDETRSTTLVFDYRCSGMSTAQTEENMSVVFSVAQAPAWATLSIEPREVPLPACLGVGQVTATLTGSAIRNATSLAPGNALVQAAWHTSGFVLNSTAQVELKLPFVAAFNVELAQSEKTERPQTVVVFPVKLTSHATGVMKLMFEIVDKAEDLQAPIPNPITLQGPDGAQRSADIPLTIQTPYRNGRVDETGTVTYRITPYDALDPKVRGEPQELTVTVHTKGFYAPGPQLFGAMLALGLAALALRRRRER